MSEFETMRTAPNGTSEAIEAVGGYNDPGLILKQAVRLFKIIDKKVVNGKYVRVEGKRGIFLPLSEVLGKPAPLADNPKPPTG